MARVVILARPAERGSYACARWAAAVLTVIEAPEDPTTMVKWSRLVGASVSTLGTWCRSARVSPRRSLEFGRMWRALRLTDGVLAELLDVMDIVEPRTLQRMMRRCGMVGNLNSSTARITPTEFLQMQTVILNPKAIDALFHVIAEDGQATA